MGSWYAALAALAAMAASGCSDRDPPAFLVFVHVESEPGHPVRGATVSRNGKALGTTGTDGRAMLSITGTEGEAAEVSVKCPEPFASPARPTSLRLIRLADKSRAPEYTVACPPNLRHVVIAVRAENGPNLPVLYLDRLVTRTDVSGAAHFALEIAPGTPFRVTLDTAENARLKPRSPMKPFTAPARDEILVFDQAFELEPAAPPADLKPTLRRGL